MMEIVWNGTMDRDRQVAEQCLPVVDVDVTTRPEAARIQLTVVEILSGGESLTAKQIAARLRVVDQLVHNKIRELVARGVVEAVDRKQGHLARRWRLTGEYRRRRLERTRRTDAASVS